MAVEFIDNESATADLWNDLFEEFDSKIERIMHGKNFVMLQPGTSFGGIRRPYNFMGMFFPFGPTIAAARPQSSWVTVGDLQTDGARTYSHSIFSDYTASLTPSDLIVHDSANKIIATKDPVPLSLRQSLGVPDTALFLDYSLEAHRILFQEEGQDPYAYWIFEQGDSIINYRPQRIWTYGQAEIVIEGGFETFEMDQRWNKYNFFRFHNCNPFAITVKFAGYFSISIPAHGSQCVRRTAVDSGYAAGFKYFHRFQTGDPTLFEMPQGNSTPWLSMGANNVVCPSIVYRIIEGFASGLMGPKVWIDPHELYDIAELYADHFPEITDATLIGDLLHHRGAMCTISTATDGKTTRSNFQFQGYQDFKDKAAQRGIKTTDNPDGTLTIEKLDPAAEIDLWGLGTNLLNSNGTPKPMVNLAFPYTLDSHKPQAFVRPVAGQKSTATASWSTLSEPDASGTVNVLGSQSASFPSEVLIDLGFDTFDTKISLHSDTVGKLKSLNAWGNSAVPNQNTSRATFENREFVLTPFGLVLNFEQRVPLEVFPQYLIGPNIVIDASEFNSIELDESTLVFKQGITFSGYGWPTTRNPAFISPRAGRLAPTLDTRTFDFLPPTAGLSILTNQGYFHPNLVNEPARGGGADFAPVTRSKSQRSDESTTIAILTPLALAYPNNFGAFPLPNNFQVYTNPDVLAEFSKRGQTDYAFYRNSYRSNVQSQVRMIGMNGLREHYNAIANAVNAVKKCRPFDFSMLRLAGGVFLFPPNTGPNSGVFSGPYRPVNQYASFAKNSQEYRICQRLGVPIKTTADLPASYHATKQVIRRDLNVTTHALDTAVVTMISNGEGQFPSYQIDSRRDFAGVDFTVEQTGATVFGASVFSGTTESEEYYWCAIEDVKSAAESRGFLFDYRAAGVPCRLKVFEVHGPFETDFLLPSGSIVFPPVTVTPGFDPPPQSGSSPVSIGSGLSFDRAAMVECIEGETAEWVADYTAGTKFGDYRPGDAPHAAVSALGFSYEAFWHYRSPDSPEDDEYRYLRLAGYSSGATLLNASLLCQSARSDDFDSEDSAVLIPAKTFEHENSTFSRQSRRNALASRQFPPESILPLKVRESSESLRALSLEGSCLITPTEPTQIVIFRDWPMSL